MSEKRFEKHLDEIMMTNPFSKEILKLSVGFREIAQPLKISKKQQDEDKNLMKNCRVS